jgi:acetylornithine deacetylase/succinyl-diaminopimelate desuccinylase-like protein
VPATLDRGPDRKPQRYSPFERRRRAAARAALYGSFVLLAVAAIGGARFMQRPLRPGEAEDWLFVKYARLAEVDLLRRYLRIDTSYPGGSEVAGAEFLARELAAAGIPAVVERLGERQANLWAFLEGEDPRALVLHHHLDVEAVADAAEWTYPPFAAEISGPWLYARGAYDMKSTGAAQLQALLDLARANRRPRRSLLLLATSGEERGSVLGSKWIVEQHPELVERMWAVLTEGGVVEAKGPGMVKYWGIERLQKAYATLTVCGSDRAALESLRNIINGRTPESWQPRLLPEVELMLRAYAPSRDRPDLRRSLAQPAELVHDVEAVQALPAYLRVLLHDEVQAGPVTAAPGGGWELLIRFLLLPDSDFDQVRRELVPDSLLTGFAVSLHRATAAREASPVEHPLYQTLVDLVREHYPGVPVGSWVLATTATDSRYFRSAGVPSYGFSPFPFVATETYTAGHRNERIGLRAYVEGVRLYGEVARRLAQ